jgi:hypothetical protein
MCIDCWYSVVAGCPGRQCVMLAFIGMYEHINLGFTVAQACQQQTGPRGLGLM